MVGATQKVYNRTLKQAQKARVSGSKDSTAFKVLYDLPLMTIQKRLTGIRKSFKNIAFVGPNPYFFLQHLPKNYEVEKFYFIENE